jgi:hypothetical protein
MLNNDIGICGIADGGHFLRQMSAIRGLPDPVTHVGLLDAYKAVGGYDGTPASDRGVYMLDMFKHWRSVGICGVKIEGFVSIDPCNPSQLAVAARLFGGVFLGLTLPKSIETQEIWSDDKPASPIIGRHAVWVMSVSSGLLVCNTWGERRPFTLPFHFARCDEAYAAFCPELLPPSGLEFDLDQLRYDLARLA